MILDKPNMCRYSNKNKLTYDKKSNTSNKRSYAL